MQRREMNAGLAAGAAALALSAVPGHTKVRKEDEMTHPLQTGGDRGYLRIATEEAFATREQIDVFLRMIRDGQDTDSRTRRILTHRNPAAILVHPSNYCSL